MLTDTQIKDVSEWADGLRALAAWAEANPELAVFLAPVSVAIWGHGLFALEKAEECARAFPRPIRKEYGDDFFRLYANFGPHEIRFVTVRENVCVKRVVSTTEEEVEEQDADEVAAALAKIPSTKVTRTREVVEWDCPENLLGVPA